MSLIIGNDMTVSLLNNKNLRLCDSQLLYLLSMLGIEQKITNPVMIQVLFSSDFNEKCFT